MGKDSGRVSGVDLEREGNAEIVAEVRRVTREVTGGNCAFADSDVGLLGRLARQAIKAGLHNELSDLSLQTRRNMDRTYGLGVFAATATEAEAAMAEHFAENANCSDSVHESAGPQDIAQESIPSSDMGKGE